MSHVCMQIRVEKSFLRLCKLHCVRLVSFPDPNNPSEDRLQYPARYCKRSSLGLFGSGNETSVRLCKLHCVRLCKLHCARLCKLHCARLCKLHCARLCKLHCARLCVCTYVRLLSYTICNQAGIHRYNVSSKCKLWHTHSTGLS